MRALLPLKGISWVMTGTPPSSSKGFWLAVIIGGVIWLKLSDRPDSPRDESSI